MKSIQILNVNLEQLKEKISLAEKKGNDKLCVLVKREYIDKLKQQNLDCNLKEIENFFNFVKQENKIVLLLIEDSNRIPILGVKDYFLGIDHIKDYLCSIKNKTIFRETKVFLEVFSSDKKKCNYNALEKELKDFSYALSHLSQYLKQIYQSSFDVIFPDRIQNFDEAYEVNKIYVKRGWEGNGEFYWEYKIENCKSELQTGKISLMELSQKEIQLFKVHYLHKEEMPIKTLDKQALINVKKVVFEIAREREHLTYDIPILYEIEKLLCSFQPVLSVFQKNKAGLKNNNAQWDLLKALENIRNSLDKLTKKIHNIPQEIDNTVNSCSPLIKYFFKRLHDAQDQVIERFLFNVCYEQDNLKSLEAVMRKHITLNMREFSELLERKQKKVSYYGKQLQYGIDLIPSIFSNKAEQMSYLEKILYYLNGKGLHAWIEAICKYQWDFQERVSIFYNLKEVAVESQCFRQISITDQIKIFNENKTALPAAISEIILMGNIQNFDYEDLDFQTCKKRIKPIIQFLKNNPVKLTLNLSKDTPGFDRNKFLINLAHEIVASKDVIKGQIDIFKEWEHQYEIHLKTLDLDTDCDEKKSEEANQEYMIVENTLLNSVSLYIKHNKTIVRDNQLLLHTKINCEIKETADWKELTDELKVDYDSIITGPETTHVVVTQQNHQRQNQQQLLQRQVTHQQARHRNVVHDHINFRQKQQRKPLPKYEATSRLLADKKYIVKNLLMEPLGDYSRLWSKLLDGNDHRSIGCKFWDLVTGPVTNRNLVKFPEESYEYFDIHKNDIDYEFSIPCMHLNARHYFIFFLPRILSSGGLNKDLILDFNIGIEKGQNKVCNFVYYMEGMEKKDESKIVLDLRYFDCLVSDQYNPKKHGTVGQFFKFQVDSNKPNTSFSYKEITAFEKKYQKFFEKIFDKDVKISERLEAFKKIAELGFNQNHKEILLNFFEKFSDDAKEHVFSGIADFLVEKGKNTLIKFIKDINSLSQKKQNFVIKNLLPYSGAYRQFMPSLKSSAFSELAAWEENSWEYILWSTLVEANIKELSSYRKRRSSKFGFVFNTFYQSIEAIKLLKKCLEGLDAKKFEAAIKDKRIVFSHATDVEFVIKRLILFINCSHSPQEQLDFLILEKKVNTIDFSDRGVLFAKKQFNYNLITPEMNIFSKIYEKISYSDGQPVHTYISIIEWKPEFIRQRLFKDYLIDKEKLDSVITDFYRCVGMSSIRFDFSFYYDVVQQIHNSGLIEDTKKSLLAVFAFATTGKACHSYTVQEFNNIMKLYISLSKERAIEDIINFLRMKLLHSIFLKDCQLILHLEAFVHFFTGTLKSSWSVEDFKDYITSHLIWSTSIDAHGTHLLMANQSSIPLEFMEEVIGGGRSIELTLKKITQLKSNDNNKEKWLLCLTKTKSDTSNNKKVLYTFWPILSLLRFIEYGKSEQENKNYYFIFFVQLCDLIQKHWKLFSEILPNLRLHSSESNKLPDIEKFIVAIQSLSDKTLEDKEFIDIFNGVVYLKKKAALKDLSTEAKDAWLQFKSDTASRIKKDEMSPSNKKILSPIITSSNFSVKSKVLENIVVQLDSPSKERTELEKILLLGISSKLLTDIETRAKSIFSDIDSEDLADFFEFFRRNLTLGSVSLEAQNYYVEGILKGIQLFINLGGNKEEILNYFKWLPYSIRPKDIVDVFQNLQSILEENSFVESLKSVFLGSRQDLIGSRIELINQFEKLEFPKTLHKLRRETLRILISTVKKEGNDLLSLLRKMLSCFDENSLSNLFNKFWLSYPINLDKSGILTNHILTIYHSYEESKQDENEESKEDEKVVEIDPNDKSLFVNSILELIDHYQHHPELDKLVKSFSNNEKPSKLLFEKLVDTLLKFDGKLPLNELNTLIKLFNSKLDDNPERLDSLLKIALFQPNSVSALNTLIDKGIKKQEEGTTLNLEYLEKYTLDPFGKSPQPSELNPKTIEKHFPIIPHTDRYKLDPIKELNRITQDLKFNGKQLTENGQVYIKLCLLRIHSMGTTDPIHYSMQKPVWKCTVTDLKKLIKTCKDDYNNKDNLYKRESAILTSIAIQKEITRRYFDKNLSCAQQLPLILFALAPSSIAFEARAGQGKSLMLHNLMVWIRLFLDDSYDTTTICTSSMDLANRDQAEFKKFFEIFFDGAKEPFKSELIHSKTKKTTYLGSDLCYSTVPNLAFVEAQISMQGDIDELNKKKGSAYGLDEFDLIFENPPLISAAAIGISVGSQNQWKEVYSVVNELVLDIINKGFQGFTKKPNKKQHEEIQLKFSAFIQNDDCMTEFKKKLKNVFAKTGREGDFFAKYKITDELLKNWIMSSCYVMFLEENKNFITETEFTTAPGDAERYLWSTIKLLEGSRITLNELSDGGQQLLTARLRKEKIDSPDFYFNTENATIALDASPNRLKCFLKRGSIITGFTGTLPSYHTSGSKFLNYCLPGVHQISLPTTFPDSLKNCGYRIVATEDDKLYKIIEFLEKKQEKCKGVCPPVWVFESSYKKASQFAEQLLTNKQLLKNTSYKGNIKKPVFKVTSDWLKEAGENNTLSVVTDVCGRGVDPKTKHKEGLYVVITYIDGLLNYVQKSRRGPRWDAPGSVFSILSEEYIRKEFDPHFEFTKEYIGKKCYRPELYNTFLKEYFPNQKKDFNNLNSNDKEDSNILSAYVFYYLNSEVDRKNLLRTCKLFCTADVVESCCNDINRFIKNIKQALKRLDTNLESVFDMENEQSLQGLEKLLLIKQDLIKKVKDSFEGKFSKFRDYDSMIAAVDLDKIKLKVISEVKQYVKTKISKITDATKELLEYFKLNIGSAYREKRVIEDLFDQACLNRENTNIDDLLGALFPNSGSCATNTNTSKAYHKEFKKGIEILTYVLKKKIPKEKSVINALKDFEEKCDSYNEEKTTDVLKIEQIKTIILASIEKKYQLNQLKLDMEKSKESRIDSMMEEFFDNEIKSLDCANSIVENFFGSKEREFKSELSSTTFNEPGEYPQFCINIEGRNQLNSKLLSKDFDIAKSYSKLFFNQDEKLASRFYYQYISSLLQYLFKEGSPHKNGDGNNYHNSLEDMKNDDNDNDDYDNNIIHLKNDNNDGGDNDNYDGLGYVENYADELFESTYNHITDKSCLQVDQTENNLDQLIDNIKSGISLGFKNLEKKFLQLTSDNLDGYLEVQGKGTIRLLENVCKNFSQLDSRFEAISIIFNQEVLFEKSPKEGLDFKKDISTIRESLSLDQIKKTINLESYRRRLKDYLDIIFNKISKLKKNQINYSHFSSYINNLHQFCNSGLYTDLKIGKELFSQLLFEHYKSIDRVLSGSNYDGEECTLKDINELSSVQDFVADIKKKLIAFPKLLGFNYSRNYIAINNNNNRQEVLAAPTQNDKNFKSGGVEEKKNENTDVDTLNNPKGTSSARTTEEAETGTTNNITNHFVKKLTNVVDKKTTPSVFYYVGYYCILPILIDCILSPFFIFFHKKPWPIARSIGIWTPKSKKSNIPSIKSNFNEITNGSNLQQEKTFPLDQKIENVRSSNGNYSAQFKTGQ